MTEETETLEIRPGFVLEVRPLSAYEMVQADAFITAKNAPEAQVSKIYLISAIRSINGTAVSPLKNYLEFGSVAQKLDFKAFQIYAEAYNKAFGESDGVDLKNESPASA